MIAPMATGQSREHPNRPPLCTGCEYTLTEPDPAKRERYTVWRLTYVDPECIQHGYMTRVNVAALLRYGD